MISRFLKQHWRPEVIFLIAAAALTRLWGIFQPQAIVFDETYFKTYAGTYLTGSYYFDPHPPLGKLILGGFAHLMGLSGPAVAGDDPSTILRLVPALAGILIIPVFYLLLRQLKASRKVATLGAALLLLDNALIVESRFILIDSMLILFGLCAIVGYLAARKRQGAARYGLLIASAFSAGCAVSTKWTGLAAVGLICLAWFVEAPAVRQAWRRLLTEGLILLLVPASVYVGVFAVHFAHLPLSGQGDAFMSQRFQETLVGNALYQPEAKMSFSDKFIDLNRAMHESEKSLRTATHPYGSPWWTWPVMQRSIYFWQGDIGSDGRQSHIYLLGNPVIWWGAIIACIATVMAYFRQRQVFSKYRNVFLLLGTAYLANFLPFSQIDRVMFLYHYFYALIFSLAIAVLGLGIMAGWMNDDSDRKPWQFSSKWSAALYGGIICLALVAFFIFTPVTYGLPISHNQLQSLMWLPSWR